MKNLVYFFSLLVLTAFISSCGDDEAPGLPDIGDGDSENIVISQNVSEDVTWTSDNIYELATRVIVEPGATLTIEAGTIIKGQTGDAANATALIVARGARIMANGTATAPIIFTSTDDNIAIGEIDSPNLDETNSRLWGGIIILGNAPISDDGNDGTDQIEGIPGNVSLAEYGGDNPGDNSGVLNYVSIRHGGTTIGDGDEINGLTLGGVGSGTTLSNIEVVANFDDGIEFFGGTVNVTNLLVWAADDDLIDIDQAYSGTITNAIAIAFSGSDHCLEIDGPEGSLTGSFTINNLSAKGSDDELADFRDGALGSINGAYFFNFVTPAFDTNGAEDGGTGEGDFSLSNPTDNNDVVTSTITTDNFESGALSFLNIQYTFKTDESGMGSVITDIFKSGTDAAVEVVEVDSNTVGADETVFGWTFAAQRNAITGF